MDSYLTLKQSAGKPDIPSFSGNQGQLDTKNSDPVTHLSVLGAPLIGKALRKGFSWHTLFKIPEKFLNLGLG
jgi:hypothetical protein